MRAGGFAFLGRIRMFGSEMRGLVLRVGRFLLAFS